MLPVRSLKSVLAAAVAASLTTVFAVPVTFAASSDNARKPVILDSQSGINDGQSGTVLQTAPFSRQPIVGAQPIATPTELAPNSSIPIVVAPYVPIPVGGGTPYPQPQPRPAPRAQ
ncbi:hypothetical protein R69927_07067 [Paraburkholderia domus]|jgi:hypothetical protein|uniref:Uncharacterized protein n=1 Tax=Paraburkholderia domus TaxID=2793075 RepID=A0A9N8N827_9BURK|nr:hypothetical protein [Paraburkholderia domus]CAE6849287.1 hypothetical protein R75483_07519 [Paraburkholderia domus]CAE6863278.1 hypothetical protein R70006_08195 [Paraburkholderia domus]CAE6885238.1 hypothetical protein R69749_07282 [Paraburkholderia domus]CAE6929678.1 hypothetical protein R69927_07067 [Paraburkholderia domus]CAE6935083.1 hypothetical protein R70199_05718 [Paraburkholderia domus]